MHTELVKQITSLNRDQIACLETEKQKYAAVKQAYKLKRSTKFQNAFISEDKGVYQLPVLECCSAVWCSAAGTHLRLLDRVVSGSDAKQKKHFF